MPDTIKWGEPAKKLIVFKRKERIRLRSSLIKWFRQSSYGDGLFLAMVSWLLSLLLLLQGAGGRVSANFAHDLELALDLLQEARLKQSGVGAQESSPVALVEEISLLKTFLNPVAFSLPKSTGLAKLAAAAASWERT